MPEKTSDVELVCGDWFGGALTSANHRTSYTLYVVGKDGKLRWQLAVEGRRNIRFCRPRERRLCGSDAHRARRGDEWY